MSPIGLRLVPLLAAVRARLGDLPAFGATLSGAGPTVLVWVESGSVAAVAAGLEGIEDSVVRPLVSGVGRRCRLSLIL